MVKLGVVDAMRVARLDRVKFNEMMAEGYYPCAPATTKGSRRWFDLDDLVGLCILADLLDLGMPPRKAGPLACRLMGIARRTALDMPLATVTSSLRFHYITFDAAAIRAYIHKELHFTE